jgi:hypothetical protein
LEKSLMGLRGEMALMKSEIVFWRVGTAIGAVGWAVFILSIFF